MNDEYLKNLSDHLYILGDYVAEELLKQKRYEDNNGNVYDTDSMHQGILIGIQVYRSAMDSVFSGYFNYDETALSKMC